MPQQTISYGDFSFPFARLSVTQANEYAPDGATLLGTAYDFSVTGVITGSSQADLSAKLDGMRGMLQQPRKPFSVQWSADGGGGGTTFWDFTKDDDIRWGPLPGNLQLEQFYGGLMARYTWTVRVAVKDCQTCNSTTCTFQARQTDVLCVTRDWSFQVDENGLTTSTVSGVLVISSTAQAQNITADNYRYLVAPDLPINFKRESANFHTSPDGLSMTYSIVDVEQVITLPQPITGGQASWAVSVTDGLRVVYELSGWYSAPRQYSKAVILQKIADLIGSRFPLSTDKCLIFANAQVIEEVFANRISFRVTASSAAGDQKTPNSFGFADSISTIGAAVTGSDGRALIPSPYGGDGTTGDSGVIALPVVIFDPCVGSAIGRGNFAQGSLNRLGTAPGTDTDSTGGAYPFASLSPPPGAASNGHKAAPFVAYRETISYETDNRIAVYTPKKAGASPLVQQTGVPILNVIQVGYSIRDVPVDRVADLQPTPGKPVFNTDSSGGTPQAVMLFNYVSTPTSEPIGVDGTRRMKIEWRYVMRYAGSIETGLNELKLPLPQDPRTTDQQISLAQLPDGLVSKPQAS